MTKSIVKVGKISVEITNPDKKLFPEGITKGDLINYYANIASHMVPYLKDRPLMMMRFPDGINGEFFYQKDASAYFPSWIKRAKIPKTGGYNNYVVCQNKATLIYLANQACITPHTWLSKIDRLDYPDKLIFDLDPSGKDFKMVCEIALKLKELLENLGLTPFVMTTGSRGLHVVCPLDKKAKFEEVRKFAVECAKKIIEEIPDKTTLEIRKNKRGKKVFIDTLRNQYGATAVAPYAVRAHPGAPIATPLNWEELKQKDISSQKYNIKNLFQRIQKTKDPWEKFGKTRKSTSRIILRGL